MIAVINMATAPSGADWSPVADCEAVVSGFLSGDSAAPDARAVGFAAEESALSEHPAAVAISAAAATPALQLAAIFPTLYGTVPMAFPVDML
jgi:hypothetical protein